MTSPTATTSQMAEALGISRHEIRAMIDEGFLPAAKAGRHNVIETTRAFVEHRVCSLPTASGVEEEFASARLEKTKWLAQYETLKVDLMKGNVHRTEHVRRIVGDGYAASRARLLAIPVRLARVLVGQKDEREVRTLLMEAIEEAIQQVPEYDRGVFNDLNREYMLGKSAEDKRDAADEHDIR